MHEKGYQEATMAGFIQLRANLIRLLVSNGLTNFKVMDSCCATNCSLTASVRERIVELRKVTSKDGVHFIDDGYRNIAERCTACISTMLSEECKPTCSKKPNFFELILKHKLSSYIITSKQRPANSSRSHQNNNIIAPLPCRAHFYLFDGRVQRSSRTITGGGRAGAGHASTEKLESVEKRSEI
jgi:hypothetical protein